MSFLSRLENNSESFLRLHRHLGRTAHGDIYGRNTASRAQDSGCLSIDQIPSFGISLGHIVPTSRQTEFSPCACLHICPCTYTRGTTRVYACRTHVRAPMYPSRMYTLETLQERRHVKEEDGGKASREGDGDRDEEGERGRE